MKHTKGKWVKVYVSGCCIGVGAQDENYADYQEMICNSILPNTDMGYDEEKEYIEADMTLISKAPEMYEAIKLYMESNLGGENEFKAVNIFKSLLKEIEE